MQVPFSIEEFLGVFRAYMLVALALAVAAILAVAVQLRSRRSQLA